MRRSLPRTARLALPALALVLAGALTGCGGDDSDTGSSGDGSSPSGTSSTEAGGDPSADAADATLEVTVDGDSISPNAQEIDLSPGDTLAVVVTSDREGELHVHSSPEQYVEFDSGTTTQDLTFDQPGSVEIEEHESDTVVAQVEVR